MSDPVADLMASEAKRREALLAGDAETPERRRLASYSSTALGGTALDRLL